MSVWATTSVCAAKSYTHSGYDPRKIAPEASIELAMVADFVYRDSGNGDRVLPYVRLSVADCCVLLTEKQAKDLIIELQDFIDRQKWRGKPRKESP